MCSYSRNFSFSRQIAIIQRNNLRKEKLFLWEKHRFMSTFGHWAKTFWTFDEKFLVWLYKFHCTCTEKTFWGKKISWKGTTFYVFLTMHKNFRTLVKIFQKGCQNFILRVQKRNILRNIFLVKNFCCQFRTFSEKFSARWRTVFGSWPKLHSTCSAEHFAQTKFAEKFLLSSVPDIERKLFRLLL